MRKYTYIELQQQFVRLGYKWFNFHLIGTRSKEDKPNTFDDYIYVINGQNIYVYQATTNPGLYWLQNFDKSKGGAAVWMPGQWIDVWALGLHHGKEPALVQVSKVSVYRDGDGDDKSECNGRVDTGLFGLNCHNANDNWTSVQIDKWSAGCQVVANPKEHASLLQLCRQSGLQKFTYTLLDEF